MYLLPLLLSTVHCLPPKPFPPVPKMVAVPAALSNFATCRAEHENRCYFRLNSVHAPCVTFDGLFAVKWVREDCYIGEVQERQNHQPQ